MRLVFIDGRSLQINVGLFADEWRVHDQWVSWKVRHGNSLCDSESTDEPAIFTCDDVVLKLWDIMMTTQLMASERHSEVAVQRGYLREMARLRLS